MNRLMAGTGLKKADRARYTAAGYVYEEEQQERELLIEHVQAGSAQDLLRDNNRIGYAEEERDSDGLPFAFLEREQEAPVRKAKKTREEQLTNTERLVRAIHRERTAVAICCVLLVINIVLFSFWAQALIDGVRLQGKIDDYDKDIKVYEASIAEAQKQINYVKEDARVRNVAQNELGMLRKERMATEKIYIQTAGIAPERQAEVQVEESAGLLDWLLSVADIFDFMS